MPVMLMSLHVPPGNSAPAQNVGAGLTGCVVGWVTGRSIETLKRMVPGIGTFARLSAESLMKKPPSRPSS
jgi:hypothetical protein